jgi:hypothetical protein
MWAKPLEYEAMHIAQNQNDVAWARKVKGCSAGDWAVKFGAAERGKKQA